MASKTIGSAVGRQPALNSLKDQQTIVTLLNRVMPEDGGPEYALPNPTEAGTAGPELIDAILAFQRKHNPPVYQDGRVDPHGRTLGKLNALARSQFPIDPVYPEPDTPPSPTPDVNIEALVWGHVNRALAAYAGEREFYKLWHAAGLLKAERNQKRNEKPINCGNKPLGYAEHYLLSRAFVATGYDGTGRTMFWVIAVSLIATYDLGKLANALLAATDRIQTNEMVELRKFLFGLIYHLGDCPMSDGPPDPVSAAWGIQGAGDGMTPL